MPCPRILLLTLLAGLAACAGPTDGPSHLARTTWRFTGIDGATPVSAKARLSLEEDRLGANVGCNGMGGPWRLEKGRLIAGPLIQTEMYCAGPVWPQEQAISALLSAAPRVELKGDRMTLKSSGHTAELERIAEEAPPPR